MTRIKIIIYALFVFGQLSAKEIVVERPAFSVRNNDFFEIEKIVMDKNATTLHIRGYANWSGWNKVDRNIYLMVDGKEYPVQNFVNLESGKKIEVDENGEYSFSLIFPPIPAKTKRFDLCTRSKDWMIWDVELKSPKKNRKPSTAHIPDEFIKAAIIKEDGKGLEAPQWKAADARLKGVIAGFKPEMGQHGVVVFVSNMITGKSETYLTNVNADGTFELAVPMTVTQQVGFRVVGKGDKALVNDFIVLSPDEETRICFDLPAWFRKLTHQRYNEQIEPKILYFTGAHAEINNQYFDANYSHHIQKMTDACYGNDSIFKMTVPEYREHGMNARNRCFADLINNHPSLTRKTKEFFRIELDYHLAYYLYYIKQNMNLAYRRFHHISNPYTDTELILPHLDEDYFSYLNHLPLNHPVSLYFNNYAYALTWCRFFNIANDTNQKSLTDILESSEGLFFDLIKCQEVSASFERMTPLTEAHIKQLKQMKEPFFAEYIILLNEKLLTRIE